MNPEEVRGGGRVKDDQIFKSTVAPTLCTARDLA